MKCTAEITEILLYVLTIDLCGVVDSRASKFLFKTCLLKY